MTMKLRKSMAEHNGKPESVFRSGGFIRLILLLAGGLFMAGCASVPEKGARAISREFARVSQATPDITGDDPRFDVATTFDDYFRHALAHNPRIRAAFGRSKAAIERIPQARALGDPTLSFEYFLDQMDTRYRVSLTQMFPAFGKRGLRANAAEAEAQAAWHLFEAERLMLLDQLSKAFYNYHYLARATAVTEENVRLLTELEKAVHARYQSGAAPFADLIKVQIERDRLIDRLAALRDQRRAQSAGLAALMNLPVDKPLPWPRVEPSGPMTVEEPVLADMLADLNPEIKAADARHEAARRRVALARRERLPDVMLGVGWMVMPGMDGRGDETDIGLMAGLTLPVWRGRIRAGIREAAAMQEVAIHERDAMRNRLRTELSMAVFQFHDAERRMALFSNSLIPKARQALTVARQAYADGSAEFMTLIDSQRTLLEFQLQAERAAADREIALADIGCCIGFDLSDWTDPTDLSDQQDNREKQP